MMRSDLDKPAVLTLWPGHAQAHVARERRFLTLRAALIAATEAMETEDTRAWIITDAGDILAPRWIKACINSPFLR